MIQSKKRIVITGGIATGKTQVSNYLRNHGYKVIDADEISREVVKPGSEGLKRIGMEFPNAINKEGDLNRETLGKEIFNNPEKRLLLNKIIHPLIFDEMKKKDLQCSSGLLFFDIPLFFEIKESIESCKLTFDQIWLVYTSMEIRINRLMARDSISREYARKKIESQMSLEKKRKLSDRIIINDEELPITYKQVEKFLKELMGESYENKTV